MVLEPVYKARYFDRRMESFIGAVNVWLFCTTAHLFFGEVVQAVSFAVREHTEGGAEWGERQRIHPSLLFSVVVCLGRAECVALPAQVAPHPECDKVARHVGTRYVITLLFDVRLLVAVRRGVLALALAPLL